MNSLKKMVGKKATSLSDQTLASDSLAAKASASSAYLKATLKASTPELKQMFSANLTQMVGEHTALSELALNKGWVNPYEQPEKQLLQTFNHSKEILNSHVTD